MLSTATMVRTGKTYRNLMVDVLPTNAKLNDRAHRIVAAAAHVDATTAQDAVRAADGHAKTAIVMLLANATPNEARERLARHAGHVRDAVGQ